MGRDRTLLRQIRRPGDAPRPGHHWPAGVCFAPVPVWLILREPQKRHQHRGRPQGQVDRLAGVGAHGGRLQPRRLDHEAGVKLQDVHWYQAGANEAGRIEKVELNLPPGVKLTRVADKSLSEMIASGEIDCALIARPPNAFLAGHPDVARLFPNFLELEEQHFAKSKVFPIMHVIAMKREILDAHPWAARNLYNAFNESKRRSVERLLDPAVSRYPLPWLPTYGRKIRDLFGGDPYPFGIEENRPTLELFLQYTFEQGIAHRHAKPEEIFPPGIMASVKI